VTATRYVTPLREGGSLPGLMEADDLGTYVVKFHGAGQGRKALVAEVIAGELARTLGLPMPALVTVDVDPILAANEPDEEVQDLLRASPGLNLGVDYLPGALDLDASVLAVDPLLAGRVLWFDGLVGNVDRSWRNPNMLFWHRRPYLIDHGATLTFAHNWASTPDPGRPYDAGEHALIGCSPDLDAADAALGPLVTEESVRNSLSLVPDVWLTDEPGFLNRLDLETAYTTRLLDRFNARDRWLPKLQASVAAHRPRQPAGPSGPAGNRPRWLGGPA
jgi:hypothetical protein